MIFPLSNIATIEVLSSTSDRSGQQIKSWVPSSQSPVQCLWTPVAGQERTTPRDEFEESGTLYVDSTVTIKVGDRVINISDSLGNVVDAGPFLVQSVKKRFNLDGTLHHLSSKLVGATS